MMYCVKEKGGDRQALHERIRKCTLDTARLMEQGEPCDLPACLAAMPEFGMTESEIVALLKPENYIGRCREQVETYLATVEPLLQGVAASCADIEV